jgi:hypothetical protein
VLGLWSDLRAEASDLMMCQGAHVQCEALVGPLVGGYGCHGGVCCWGFVVFGGFWQ